MGAAYAIVIVVVLLLVVGAIALRRMGQHQQADHRAVVGAEHTLRYHVPAGQDPAAALVSLSRAGFEAVADAGDSHALTIRCPLGREQREEVRLVLEEETANTLHGQEQGSEADPPSRTVPIRFADEA
jgi:hypothetical protein